MTVAIKKVMDLPEDGINVLSKLIHPSIIRYYGTVTENISHFTVTEFAENGSIYDYIHVQRKHPPMEQRLLWLKQMAEGTASRPIKVSHSISSTFTPQVEAPLGKAMPFISVYV